MAIESYSMIQMFYHQVKEARLSPSKCWNDLAEPCLTLKTVASPKELNKTLVV